MSSSSATQSLVDVAAGKTKRQRDVLGGRERRQQVVGLEDEADAIAPELREPALAQALERDAVDGDAARGRPVEPGHDVHERRLAGARRAHDGDELALVQRDGDAAQGVDGGVAAAVTPGDVTGSGDGGGIVGPAGGEWW